MAKPSAPPSYIQKLRYQFDDAQAERRIHEPLWDEITTFIRPVRGPMVQNVMATDNVMPDAAVFDGTAFTAADHAASGLYGFMTNPANTWFELGALDRSLEDRDEHLAWIEQSGRITLASFGVAVSDFYGQSPEFLADAVALGTAPFWSEEIPGEQRFHDAALPLSECWFEKDAYGRISGMYRKWSLSGVAMARRFGLANLSEGVQTRIGSNPQDRSFVVQAVLQNDEFTPGHMGPRGMPWLSVIWEDETGHEIRRGGYREKPFQVARWAVAPGHIYGIGRGRFALPDVKQLNIMQKAHILALEKMVNPTILTVDEAELPHVRLNPNEILPGGLDERGNQLVQAMVHDMRGLPYSLEQANQLREQIKDAFYFSLMQLVGRTGLTATEVLQRDEEKMRLMAPHQGKLQTEWLSQLIARRFAMLSRLGQLPPAPPGLNGAAIEVRYISPMAKAQRSQEAGAALRLIDGATALAQIKPESLDTLNGDELVAAMQDGFGAPRRSVHSADDVAEIRRRRAEQAEMEQEMVQAETGANVIAKVGQAMPQEMAA